MSRPPSVVFSWPWSWDPNRGWYCHWPPPRSCINSESLMDIHSPGSWTWRLHGYIPAVVLVVDSSMYAREYSLSCNGWAMRHSLQWLVHLHCTIDSRRLLRLFDSHTIDGWGERSVPLYGDCIVCGSWPDTIEVATIFLKSRKHASIYFPIIY